MADFSKFELPTIPDELLEGIAGGLPESLEMWARGAIHDFKYLYEHTKEESLAYFQECIPDNETWKSEFLTYFDENWDSI